MKDNNLQFLILGRIASVKCAKGNPYVQNGLYREAYGFILGVHAAGAITDEEWKIYDKALENAYTGHN